MWALAALIVIPTTDMGSAEIPAAAAMKQSQRVLVLYSDERLLPANIIMDESIRATFAVGTTTSVEFHSEFLDAARFPGDAHEQRQRDYLAGKISGASSRLVDRCQRRGGAFSGEKPGVAVFRSAHRLLLRGW